jgi:hypothetical protein
MVPPAIKNILPENYIHDFNGLLPVELDLPTAGGAPVAG